MLEFASYGDALVKDAYYEEVVAAVADIARDSQVLLVDHFDATRNEADAAGQ